MSDPLSAEECIRLAEFYVVQAEGDNTLGPSLAMYGLGVSQAYATLAIAKLAQRAEAGRR